MSGYSSGGRNAVVSCSIPLATLQLETVLFGLVSLLAVA